MTAVASRLLTPVVLAVLVATVLSLGTLAVTGLVGPSEPTADGPSSVLATRPDEPAASEDEGAAGSRDASPAPSPRPTPAASPLPDDAGVLPGPVPTALGGALVVVPGNESAPGAGISRRVRVEVEAGLPIDPAVFATFVMDTLNDPRGWGADESVSFARTDGEADIRVVVASPSTIDAMCAPLDTNGRWSCGRYGHAALNALRWVHGADAFLAAGGSLTDYRQYLVNHEVGHLLGVQHTGCPAPGQLAPIMLQQSLGLDGCLPNGWPHP